MPPVPAARDRPPIAPSHRDGRSAKKPAQGGDQRPDRAPSVPRREPELGLVEARIVGPRILGDHVESEIRRVRLRVHGQEACPVAEEGGCARAQEPVAVVRDDHDVVPGQRAVELREHGVLERGRDWGVGHERDLEHLDERRLRDVPTLRDRRDIRAYARSAASRWAEGGRARTAPGRPRRRGPSGGPPRGRSRPRGWRTPLRRRRDAPGAPASW